MLVMTPTRYVPAWVLDGNLVIPLWTSHPATSMEYPDVWKSVRVGPRSHAIHHVTLPASCVLPPLSEGLANPPLWTDAREHIINAPSNEFWTLHDTTKSTFHYYYPLPVRIDGETFTSVVQVTLRLYQTQGLTRYYTITGQTALIYFEDERRARVGVYRCTSESDVKVVYPWVSIIPSVDELVTAVEDFLVYAEWQSSHSTRTYNWITVANWELSKLRRYLDTSVQSVQRFEDSALVEDHDQMVWDGNPLARKHEWKTVPSRGKPLWVHSDVNFLKGKALAYLAALRKLKIGAPNTLKDIASLYRVLTSFAFQPESTSDVFNTLVKTQSPLTLQGTQRRVSVDLPAIPDYATNAWLGGRYQWATTVHDAEMTWEYFYEELLKMMGSRSNESKCHGVATVEDATFRCTFTVKDKALEGVNKYFETMFKLGLEPNAYVMWDFVPYSFVVDWFFPVGDALSAYVESSHYSPMFVDYIANYGKYEFCYSVCYSGMTPFGMVEVYTRWYECGPPNVDTSYVLLDDSSTKDKIACWRVVDGLCLLLR